MRENGGVDANHLTIEIEQRSTRIATVDRGIGLDEIIIRTVANIAATSRDNASCHRAAKTKGIANGQHPVTNPQAVGITEFDSGEFNILRVDFQHRNIGLLILAKHLGPERLIIGKNDGDFLGVLDHVIIRDDDALFINDEA